MEKPTTIPRRVELSSGSAAEAQEPLEEVSIVLTDLQLHTTIPRKPKKFAEGVRKTITTGNPGRTHHRNAIRVTDPSTGALQINIPMAGVEEIIAHFAAKGQRVRFFMPKTGIPIFLGKDATERLEALKQKDQLQ